MGMAVRVVHRAPGFQQYGGNEGFVEKVIQPTKGPDGRVKVGIR